MIIDANVLVFLHVNNPAFTPEATEAYERGSAWYAPRLWRSELRSALMQYVRVEENRELPGSKLTLEEAISHMADAELLISGSFRVDSESVLRLSAASGCSPYDCEYVELAKRMDTRLLTYDEKVKKAYPDLAISPAAF